MQAFKKARRRFKERVSEQVLGGEKFVDPVFDAGLDRFASWNYHLSKVEAAHVEYAQAMEIQKNATSSLAQALTALHFSAMQMRNQDDTMFASEIDFDTVLKQPIEHFARIQTTLANTLQTQWYREAVVDHLRLQQEVIPQILTRVHKRDNMVLDYSAYKRKAQKETDDFTKRLEREKKVKASRLVLDQQTSSLMATFTELENQRPTDIYEDLCSVLALQLDFHRRSTELLEKELPYFQQMSFPLCQLSLLSNAQRSKNGNRNVIRYRRPQQTKGPSASNSSNSSNSSTSTGPNGQGTKGTVKLNPALGFNQMQSLSAPTHTSSSLLVEASFQSIEHTHRQHRDPSVPAPPPLPSRRRKQSLKPPSKAPQPAPNKMRARSAQQLVEPSSKMAPPEPKKRATTLAMNAPSIVTAVCKADFVATSASELSMTSGERMIVKRKENNGWWLVSKEQDESKVGWAPSTFF